MTRTMTGATAFGIAVLVAATHAQVGRGGSAWLTSHADAQRTSWIRSDALISVPAMSKPGFDLQWKTTLDNANRRSYGLGSGVSAPGVTLFVPMQLVTGSSNNVYAIDSDTGYLVWQRHFDAALPAPTDACPGGTLSAATRIVTATPAPVVAEAQRGGGGRATQGYHSVIGQPGEGAPVEVRGGGAGRGGAPPAAGGRGPGAAPTAPAAAPAPGRGAGQGGGFGRGGGEPIPGAPPAQVAGGGGLNRPSGVVYVISSDGVLHVMGLQSGKDLQKPAPFVPANSRWSDPIAVGTMLYTSTSSDCGGAPNAVWAIDLESPDKPVVSWKTGGGAIVGPLAFMPDGTVVAVVGPAKGATDGKSNAVVALDPKTLALKEATPASRRDLVTGPVIFQRGPYLQVAVGTKESRVIVLNGEALGEAGTLGNLVTVTFEPAERKTAVDSLATWQQDPPAPAGDTPPVQWILVPTGHGIDALGLDDRLTLRWESSLPTTPATPIIVNGVVFVLETGRSATGAGSAAVLHAYEGKTGKELWTSGKTMTASAAPGSLWSAFGQIYVGTTDGTLYAFGFNDERR